MFKKITFIILISIFLITFSAELKLFDEGAFAQDRYFSDNFESGSGKWTLDAPWAISDEDSHSPDNCLTDSPDSISYNSSIDIPTTSISINCIYAFKSIFNRGGIE